MGGGKGGKREDGGLLFMAIRVGALHFMTAESEGPPLDDRGDWGPPLHNRGDWGPPLDDRESEGLLFITGRVGGLLFIASGECGASSS